MNFNNNFNCIYKCIYLVVLSGFYMSCSHGLKQSDNHEVNLNNENWFAEFTTVGTYSSPRVADLNQDGVKDIIVGAGKFEFEKTDTAVVALSGATGETLWIVPARDQVFGSATLLDINQDGVQDVIINGRSAILLAISGSTGDVIWEFFPEGDTLKASDYGLYNFYNPQIIPDQTENGLKDLLVSNGGDVRVEPFNPNRPPGKLMVIDASNGKRLAEELVPDLKETYMSPVVSKFHEDDDDYTIIFGTGGETIKGNLYRTTLGDLMAGDISDAEILLTGEHHGFIAPPVLADITQNGYLDMVANAVSGRTVAINGKTNEILWENKIMNVEAYASFGVGYFNNDEIPDFFSLYGEGVFPDLNNSIQVMYNGINGNIELLDTLGLVQTASPVIADFNNNGFDDALLSVNFSITNFEKGMIDVFHNILVVYDFKNHSVYDLTAPVQGMNLASTPWIGDLNNNGKLDIIYCVLTEASLSGFRVYRYASDIEITSEIRWGAYMGSNYNGIFR